MSFSKITKAFSDLDISSIAKKSTSLTDLTKKIDLTDFTSAFKKTAGDIDTGSLTTVTKKADGVTDVGGDLASSLKKFETQSGASAVLSKTAAVMAKNPKMTVLGISALSAAGYVAFQMANGKTFDEAMGELLEIVEDAVEDVVEVAAGGTTDIVFGIVDAFMRGLFGDDYLTYVKGAAISVLVVFILGIVLKIYSLVKK